MSRKSSGPISFYSPSPRLFCRSIRTQAHAMSEHNEQCIGLVVGMGGRMQERTGNAKLANGKTERDMALVWPRRSASVQPTTARHYAGWRSKSFRSRRLWNR